MQFYNKFATVEDVLSADFASLNKVFDQLSVRYGLADHADVNTERYPWSAELLGKPAFYASRLWEYPFAVLAAQLEPGMCVADIGCGMTAFTIYLKEHARCNVVGVDPDVFEAGVKYKSHGVSQEFLTKTGLKVLRGDMTALPLETDSQDRVFCISVMEHVPEDVRRRGMQEIARVLKPGGRAIITVDMSMWFFMNRPLDLVWDSGLNLVNPIDLSWPVRRFGKFSHTGQPADVFGMTLVKQGHQVETEYRQGEEPAKSLPSYIIPTLIPGSSGNARRNIAARIYQKIRKILPV